MITDKQHRTRSAESLVAPSGALTLTVPDAARYLAMDKTKLWSLIREGRFPTVREGRWVRVPVDGMKEWVRRNTV